MPCPHTGGAQDLSRYFRRDILKTALASGGLAALAACMDQSGVPDVPRGVESIESVPERQFEWNGYLGADTHQNIVFPVHQLIVFFEYTGSIPPSNDDRRAVRNAFNTLDRAFQRGNGGISPYAPGGQNMPGLLYMMGYSQTYFERYNQPVSSSLTFYGAEQLLEELDEDNVVPDAADAALVMASDYTHVLLASELALLGELETLNGVDVSGDLSGVFDRIERRTGFVGPTVPRRELNNDDIHARSPLGMGFISGFADNQASEDRVALTSGGFTDGTILQISRLSLDLDKWYDESKKERVELMFSPDHTVDDVGEVGEFLARDSGLTQEMEADLETHAREKGKVGHTQKLAAARDENFDPVILRRSEAVSTGSPHPGFNFTSAQRSLDDFVNVRRVMEGKELDVELDEDNSGILGYHTVEKRGAYLIPPRSNIALPPPQPEPP